MRIRGDNAPAAAFIVEPLPNEPQYSRVVFWENAEPYEEEKEGQITSGWEYDEYVLQLLAREGLDEEIAANLAAFLTIARTGEYERLAAAVREQRNALLAATDAEMAFDRLGLSVPSGTTFSAWLTFLKGLGNAINGDMARYRQALRDLPQQPGFPYNVEWPEL